nr:PREDICTED: uncharacterized protein LOC105271026 [Fopius arisanus]
MAKDSDDDLHQKSKSKDFCFHIIPETDDESSQGIAETSPNPVSHKKSDYPDVWIHTPLSDSSMAANVHSLNYQSSIQAHNLTYHEQNLTNAENIPQDVLDHAAEAEATLIPKKSRAVYDRTYNNFRSYIDGKKIRGVNEVVLLGYFNMLARDENKAPGSLWAIYSMLKKTLYNSTHQKKKATTFTDEQIAKFLRDAPDNTYLATKVALILGLNGLCRRSELYNITLDEMEDHKTCMNFTLTKTKNGTDRQFSVTGEFYNI